MILSSLFLLLPDINILQILLLFGVIAFLAFTILKVWMIRIIIVSSCGVFLGASKYGTTDGERGGIETGVIVMLTGTTVGGQGLGRE